MSDKILWEYRVQDFGGLLRGMKSEELTEKLNVWGEEGWEVISCSHHPSSDKITVIAKRPLSEDDRRRRTRPNYNY